VDQIATAMNKAVKSVLTATDFPFTTMISPRDDTSGFQAGEPGNMRDTISKSVST